MASTTKIVEVSHPMTSKDNAEARAYLTQMGLEGALSEAIAKILIERPEYPQMRLSELLNPWTSFESKVGTA